MSLKELHDLVFMPNKTFEYEQPRRNRFQFLGPKGEQWFEYGDTPEDALTSLCTYHRLNAKKVKLVKQLA